MITVTVGTNVKRDKFIVSPDETIRETLQKAGIDVGRATMHLDGVSLGVGDVNKSYADFGYNGTPGHDTAFLLQVAKVDNA